MDILRVLTAFQSSVKVAGELMGQPKLFEKIEIEDFDCDNWLPATLPQKTVQRGKNEVDWNRELLENFFYKVHMFDERGEKINNYPCLYIIKISSNHGALELRDAILSLDQVGLKIRIPSIKKGFDLNDKILYVGKAESNVGARLATHLGYIEKDFLHGLQLKFWANTKVKGLKLNFTVLRFDKGLKNFLGAFEENLARELKPIIGRH